MPLPTCDFCSAMYPTRTYDAGGEIRLRAFVESGPQMGPAHHFTRLWAACDECGDLIDLGDLYALEQRALQDINSIWKGTPEFVEVVNQAIAGLYSELRNHPLVRVK